MIRTLALLAMLLALGACGQKGPLKLPDAPPPPATPAQEPPPAAAPAPALTQPVPPAK